MGCRATSLPFSAYRSIGRERKQAGKRKGEKKGEKDTEALGKYESSVDTIMRTRTGKQMEMRAVGQLCQGAPFSWVSRKSIILHQQLLASHASGSTPDKSTHSHAADFCAPYRVLGSVSMCSFSRPRMSCR